MSAPPTSERRLRRVGETCLWLLVIGFLVVSALEVAARLRLVVLPVMLAVVLATFLAPPAAWLRDRGWSDALAAVTVLLLAIVFVGGTLGALAPLTVDQFSELDVAVTGLVDEVQAWLRQSPLPISREEISRGLENLQSQVSGSLDALASRLVTGALLALEVLTALILAVVVLFFLLKDGERIWGWIVGLTPPQRREDIDALGHNAWDAVGGFLRGQTLVALFDAILIGLALVLIGVPLALPLAVLTFFGAYVPVIGATVTGMLAVALALVSEGPVAAALTLGAILAVQQIEGNIFQPIVVGRAVDVHPLAILLGVTAGGVLAGIIGIMIAAPLVAVFSALLRSIRERAPDPEADGGPADGRGAAAVPAA